MTNMDNTGWKPSPRYLMRENLMKSVLKKEKLKDKTCLEIGYGAGDTLELYLKLGLRVYGFDISREAHKTSRDRIKQVPNLAKRVNFLENEEQVKQQKYDYVMAFEVLEHIDDDIHALMEWRSYLKPGGRLLFSVPCHMKKWGSIDMWAGHFRRYEKKGNHIQNKRGRIWRYQCNVLWIPPYIDSGSVIRQAI